MDNNEIMVSIVCTTYNHEAYVKDAIEGFLMQKTNFPFEIIIHDDASTDRTVKIISDYVVKNPQIIIPILQETNQYTLGVHSYNKYIWPRVRGKYVAMCEGDDYWIDPCKLQRQVDFLETNCDCSLCFHNTLVLYQNKSNQPFLFCPSFLKDGDKFETKDVIEAKFSISTCSMLFRTKAVTERISTWLYNGGAGEKSMQLIISLDGNAGYIDKVMSVYRSNQNSVSFGQSATYARDVMTYLYNEFNKYTEYKFRILIDKRNKELLSECNRIMMRSKYGLFFHFLHPFETTKKLLVRLKKIF